MVTVFVEAARGSREKHAYDETNLAYKGKGETLLPYPYPYGFILGTRTPEGDCVDCYLVTEQRFSPGERVEAEPAGLLEFFEEEELDHKVLATIPGEEVALNEELRERLESFIYGIFEMFPQMRVRVGELRSQEAAEGFVERWRERPAAGV